MIDIWHIGNTGVRNPARIQEALKAYASSFSGSVVGRDNEIAFEQFLRDQGIIPKTETKRHENDGTYGRKWRLVFYKNGFIYPPDKARGLHFSAHDIGGAPCAVTPLGNQLIQADTAEAAEEIFLRAVSCHTMPLPERLGEYYSPVRWVLAILLKLEEKCGHAFLSFPEFAVCAQTSDPRFDIDEVANRVLDIRRKRDVAHYKKKFDQELYAQVGRDYPHKSQNFKEYADTNLRYMRITGLFKTKGRGIELKAEKHALAVALARDQISSRPIAEIYKDLDNGPSLPTDELSLALDSLQELIQQLETRNIAFVQPSEDDLRTALAINRIRRTFEYLLKQQDEIDFANQQRYQWREISDYMSLLIAGRDHLNSENEDHEISIPSGEAPAYFEWSLWRAILALDHLKNLPYEVRNFNVDSDLLPRSTAAGGMPDLVAEFETCTVVIEVTLTQSSRQQAMEGSPVRKHVADLAARSDKPVFGLFIANSFDPNTIDDFQRGVWYGENHVKYDLHIIPLTLRQFRDCFMSIFAKNQEDKQPLLTLMRLCDEDRKKYDIYGWQDAITERVNQFIRS